MHTTLAFDIYGTLIDPLGVGLKLAEFIGENNGRKFASTWRAKQLEYTFRKGLMEKYEDFKTCTRQALDWACDSSGHALNPDQKEELMNAYAVLPAFPDAKACLEKLLGGSERKFAFSNGTAAAVEGLLRNAGIRRFFDGVVSVEAVKTFKPSPKVYRHFVESAGCAAGEAWLVSSNPFDVIGAVSFGMKAVWLNRAPGNAMDPWGVNPTAIIRDLKELPSALGR